MEYLLHSSVIILHDVILLQKNKKILQLKFFLLQNLIILQICNIITYVINVGGSNTSVSDFFGQVVP